MSVAAPVCESAEDIVAALGAVDSASLEVARADALARPLAYVVGSGEADEVALLAGLKPLLRQLLPADRAEEARARFEPMGLCVEVTAHRSELPSTAGVVVFVGRDARRVREAKLCEEASDHDRSLGRLLGYPRCCVDAYVELPPPKRNLDAFARAAQAATGAFRPRLNTADLGVFHFVTWLPCSFACPLASAYADAVALHISQRHGQRLGGVRRGVLPCPPRCRHELFVEAIDRALAAHRLVVSEDVQISVAGRFAAGQVRVREIWPTARDRHPAAALAGDALEAVARLTGALRGSETLALVDGDLVVDGAPLLRLPHALLLPFGPLADGAVLP